jgi:predicted N-formylglutamate amidohydrolase
MEVLQTHRGWDPGALPLARRIAASLQVPLHEGSVSRLLVELNRSPGHPRQFSEFTGNLPDEQKQQLIETYYEPHRRAVADHVAQSLRQQSGNTPVIHLSIHTFTPVLDGVPRRADLAWLYDPKRRAEQAWCKRWQDALRDHCPTLQLRCNYPYRGSSDGLTTTLRRQFGPRYLGIEIEVNQRWPLDEPKGWESLQQSIIDTLPRGAIGGGGVERRVR